MSKGRDLSKGQKAKPSRSHGRAVGASSAEERRVWAIMEQARKNVREAVKHELEGEVISGDVLNFRLR
jgi:hypothetical protein